MNEIFKLMKKLEEIKAKKRELEKELNNVPSRSKEYRRLKRQIRKLDDEIDRVWVEIMNVADAIADEVRSEIEELMQRLKEEFSDNYDVTTLKYGDVHGYEILKLYHLFDVSKEFGVPLEKYKAGVEIKFHWFRRGDINELKRIIEFIKANKPKDVIVIVHLDNRPDHSDVAWEITQMLREGKKPFEIDGVDIKATPLLEEPVFFIF